MLFMGTCPVPLETGNPELDFINELYATALRSGISPYSLRLKMVNLSSRMAITTTTSGCVQQGPAAIAHRLPTKSIPLQKGDTWTRESRRDSPASS